MIMKKALSCTSAILAGSLASFANADGINSALETKCSQISEAITECFVHIAGQEDLKVGKEIIITKDFTVLGDGSVLNGVQLSEEILSEYLRSTLIPLEELRTATWCESAE